MVKCPDAATAQRAWLSPAGSEVVWAGAGRECGRVPGSDSGREEGGAQARAAGGLGQGWGRSGSERRGQTQAEA